MRGSGFGPAGLAAVVFLTAIQNPAIAIGIKDEKKSEHKFVVENVGARHGPTVVEPRRARGVLSL